MQSNKIESGITYNSNGGGGGLTEEPEMETTRAGFLGDFDFLRAEGDAEARLETPVSDLRLLEALLVPLAVVMRGAGMGVDTRETAAPTEEQEGDTLPTLPEQELLLCLLLLSLFFRSIF